ncbi:hypothetical protein QFZ32_008137 [Streptomyces canus]|nr:hypothetical protein [Streptomyces canus]
MFAMLNDVRSAERPCLALAVRAGHIAERNVEGKRFLVNALRRRHSAVQVGEGRRRRANSFDVWERFHGGHVHATMLAGRFPSVRFPRASERGESVATPPMRTFISGRVLTLFALGLTTLAPGPAAAGHRTGPLPDSFGWSSTGPLIGPKPDAGHPVVSVKDPTVFRSKNLRHPYMTTADGAGAWSLARTSSADWSRAADAPLAFRDPDPNIGNRHAAVPQVFHFAPHKLSYTVHQTGPPAYSTTKDPAGPGRWSAPRSFFDSETPALTESQGSGCWLDFWTICDRSDGYLFSDDNGHQYRSRTTLAEFPNGFRDTEIVIVEPNCFDLFEASNVHRLGHSGTYLMLVGALATGNDWRRCFRAWTADSPGGTWKPPADTEANALIRSNDVTFQDGRSARTKDFSHGEAIREGVDRSHSQLPWRWPR